MWTFPQERSSSSGQEAEEGRTYCCASSLLLCGAVLPGISIWMAAIIMNNTEFLSFSLIPEIENMNMNESLQEKSVHVLCNLSTFPVDQVTGSLITPK